MSEAEQSDDGRDSTVEQIADPDNYNLRRRLKQLHDAKQDVREVKRSAVRTKMTNKRVRTDDVNRIVAEAVVDYICELRPLLDRQGQWGEFKDKTVVVDDSTEIAIGKFHKYRGHGGNIEGVSEGYLSYQISMRVWDQCNEALEQVAGIKMERQGLPHEAEFNSVEP